MVTPRKFGQTFRKVKPRKVNPDTAWQFLMLPHANGTDRICIAQGCGPGRPFVKSGGGGRRAEKITFTMTTVFTYHKASLTGRAPSVSTSQGYDCVVVPGRKGVRATWRWRGYREGGDAR